MATVLEKIVDVKKQEVELRKKEVPVEELQTRILTINRPRNFYSAVAKHPIRKVNLIAEIKKASPSAE